LLYVLELQQKGTSIKGKKIEETTVSRTCVLLKPKIIKVWQRSQKWYNGIIQQPTKIILIIKSAGLEIL
jgi:hypothetical protein